jgi:NADH-quinone oxidoreductase subunit E
LADSGNSARKPWSDATMRTPSQSSAELDPDFVSQVISRQVGRPGALLAILQEIQNSHPRKYLPRATLELIAAKTNVPLSRIFSVVTFYALFNLKPQGRHTVSVCRGTACHTRGSRDLLEKLMFSLGFQSVQDDQNDQLALTTADGAVTLRTVACFGQCALAPVVEVDHSVFGHMNERMLMRELEALGKREQRS